MTGPEHYLEAERLISGCKHSNGAFLIEEGIAEVLAAAQVHATLAQVAAYALTQRIADADDPASEPEHVDTAEHDVKELTARLDLAHEYRVALPEGLGSYDEVVIRRDQVDPEKWAVCDGADSGMEVWVDGFWQYIGDVGRRAGFCYSLDEAFDVAERVVAETERDRSAAIRAAREGGDAR